MNNMKDHCTKAPEFLFGEYVGEPCCSNHDDGYTGTWYEKIWADILFYICLTKVGLVKAIRGLLEVLRGIGLMIVAIPAFIAVLIFGWYFWWKAKNK